MKRLGSDEFKRSILLRSIEFLQYKTAFRSFFERICKTFKVISKKKPENSFCKGASAKEILDSKGQFVYGGKGVMIILRDWDKRKKKERKSVFIKKNKGKTKKIEKQGAFKRKTNQKKFQNNDYLLFKLCFK